MKMLRALLFNIFFWSWTIILAFVAIPVALLGDHDTMRRYARFWMTGIQSALSAIVGLRYEVKGLERLPAGPVIIASKHQSAWETLFFFLLRKELAIALKEELTMIPLFGWYLMKARNIKLDRGGAAKTLKSLVKGAKQAVKNGDSVLIFPEGTRQAPGAEPDYKPGVAALYGALDIAAVPVALNSGCFWGRRSFIKEPGLITVEILEPIGPGLKRAEFMGILESRIENATAKLIDRTNQMSGSD